MVPLYGSSIPPLLFHIVAIVGGLAAGFLAWIAQRLFIRRLADIRAADPQFGYI
ncbi:MULTISPECIES: hypothetical protein [unclassified Sinorhizobium]|uniref:hypothetical protein n=1 Tax=unclassified Sinorhizobium TaxID=2613772 RepID=UPI0035264074